MTRTRLSDYWWIGQCQTHYVCPLLMTLSCWIYRMRRQPVYWYAHSEFGGIVRNGNWEAPCLFPRSWVLAECRFWNSRPGVRLRMNRKGI